MTRAGGGFVRHGYLFKDWTPQQCIDELKRMNGLAFGFFSPASLSASALG